MKWRVTVTHEAMQGWSCDFYDAAMAVRCYRAARVVLAETGARVRAHEIPMKERTE